MEKNPTFSKIKILEEWHCFSIFEILFMSGLIENSWILIPSSIINLL